MAKGCFFAKALAKDYVYIHIYSVQSRLEDFRSMFCRKWRMAMATRNTVTSVRPMIYGPWAFRESRIYR